MKLYSKKLNSLEALRREKIRLRYERRHTDASDLFPIAELGRGKLSGKAKAGTLGTIFELINAKNDLQTALALSRPVLNMIRKRRHKKQALREEMGLPKKKSFMKRLAMELLIGYATGKAVLMGVQGIRMILKRRKRAKLRAKLQAQI